jgi:hypothetical protein
MGGKSSSTTSNTTNNTNTQMAVEGDSPVAAVGETVNIDATNPELIEATFDTLGAFIDVVKENNTQSMNLGSTLANSAMGLAERTETNEQLNWLYDMAKLGLPVLAIILIAYFYFRKGK